MWHAMSKIPLTDTSSHIGQILTTGISHKTFEVLGTQREVKFFRD